MEYPKISVVTPSYNQGKFLEETILSVLNQNYPNLEYIVIDGGSNDNSVEIIGKYADKLTYWQSKPDGGQSVAINEGFRHATGDIYCWLNSDDQFADGALTVVGEYFFNHSECQWLSGVSTMKDLNDKILHTITPKKLDFSTLIDWYNNTIYQPATFWRKTIWNETGGLNENLHYSMDFDLWLKFAKIEEGHVISQLLATALKHNDMKTNKFAYESVLETAMVLCAHGEFLSAKEMLLPTFKRSFELQQKFRWIVNNSLYRKWRIYKARNNA